MPTYSFFMTQHVVLEAEFTVEAANVQDAMAQLAERSQARKDGGRYRQGLDWDTGPDGDGATTIVHSISRDGERLRVNDDDGKPIKWFGLNGQFDMEGLPEELQGLEG